MAKTGTRPTARPRRPRQSSSGNRWQSVGRQRKGTSLSDQFWLRLSRLETVGLGLIGASFVAMVLLLPSAATPSLLTRLVEAFGLNSITLLLALAGLGLLVFRRQTALLLQYVRPLGALLLFLPLSAGLLGLLKPDWELGDASLATVSAGGELGRTLTEEPLGLLAWAVSSVAFLAVVWPRGILAGFASLPVLASMVWGWHLERRLLHGAAALIDFAFPTRPPPDERAARPPEWLPEDEEDYYEDEEGPEPAPEVFEARAQQAQLPLEDEDSDEEPTPQLALTSEWKLPPMDLLVAAAPPEETARPDNTMRASLIVETLASFGVDASVASYHEGPVVTQFDVEPGWEVKYRQIPERDKDGKPLYDKDGKPRSRSEEVSRTRVRVNQITSLANDLALALAAPSLRIEAPVPGRSVVGIEVPNTSASVVTMRSVIETPAFQRLAARAKLALPLGKSVSGEPVVADLAKMPHLLIAGATGSGKSVAINSIIASLLMQARPEEVRFVMIDPKRVELSSFAMIPHLAFSSIVVDVEKVVGTLGAVLHEMEDRYKRFASLAVRNLEAYNKHPKVTQRMPYWVVIIDELADLMMAAPFEVERQICRLAQLARATGIHLIVATQRPSVDVITGLIKANFPTRIAFAMSSQVDSRTILDMAGAERLLGRGDMLYLPTDASKPKRVQGVFVSDQEIDRLVGYWAQQRVSHSTPVFDHLLDAAQAAMEEEEDADPMYERAKNLAQEHSRLSTSMLQRRLRIGYPRAARIMDRLEEEGIVGESGTGGGGSREVIAPDDDDDDDEPGFRPRTYPN
jgi:S-DNA-T family DNA segregation ATPase FtsK/SpoIIIE